MPDRSAIESAYQTARSALFAERTPEGVWTGELSPSALSAATSVAALALVSRDRHAGVIARGVRWLADHRNADGGWGDTPDSPSNLATTWLSVAALRIAGADGEYPEAMRCGRAWLEREAGASLPERICALEAVYGKDRTFATPILTMCALAGEVDWRAPLPLPFEFAAAPSRLYSALRLHVVSYALPALISIGQLLHSRQPTRNPLRLLLRRLAARPALRKLERIQPSSGGFLEATPLTAFVTMSLAANGRAEHPVARKGVEFLLRTARPDGSWPIEVNLKTWLTTMATAALSHEARTDEAVLEYLLSTQQAERHPYTSSAPGGWAWNDLPGGVPDADDTSGALLALHTLGRPLCAQVRGGLRWLLRLQNRDGGWPTFCRGWGRLPFDRSAPDLTAHALRALAAWHNSKQGFSAERAIRRGFLYLTNTQNDDGSWFPLWFGNQSAPGKRNPVYGTSRVLAAFRDAGLLATPQASFGAFYLLRVQNPDGSWGGAAGVGGSVEETALALDALAACSYNETVQPAWEAGLDWLVQAVEGGRLRQPAPIGLYFEQLWYSEKLYPIVWTVSALARALNVRSVPVRA